jgi:hypothetical protein
MRFRYLLLIFVVVFGATLAVIVGEQLSTEAMSVMVGVVAGVGASIPTSLLVMWFAMRTVELRAVPEAPRHRVYPMEPPEPRIVVVTAPRGPMARDRYAPAYEQPGPYGYEPEPEVLPALPAPVQRRFTVVGGSEGFMLAEPQYQEALWQR